MSILLSSDDEDLRDLSWSVNNGYLRRYRQGAGRKGPNRHPYLHVMVLERCQGPRPSPVHLADHVNGNKLDNRRENLRWTTPVQSCWNTPGRGNCGYKGVYQLPKYPHKFTAQLKGRYIGIYNSAEEAARAHDAEARALGGGFARLNFPGESA